MFDTNVTDFDPLFTGEIERGTKQPVAVPAPLRFRGNCHLRQVKVTFAAVWGNRARSDHRVAVLDKENLPTRREKSRVWVTQFTQICRLNRKVGFDPCPI